MIPVSPSNKIIVAIESKFQDQVQLDSGISLFRDTTFRPGWHATVTGIVQSVPERIKGKYPINVGDEVAFSYLAVYSRKYVDNREDLFYEDPPRHPQIQTWSNKKGMTIIRIYLMNDTWEMRVYDKQGNLHVKEIGKEEVIERVMGMYPFLEDTEMIYKNVLPVNGKDYWMVEDQFLFAVKRNGKVTMLNDYVLLDAPIDQKQRIADSGLVLLSDFSEKQDHETHLKVVNAPDNKWGVAAGETVIVDTKKMQRYELWGKDYVLQRMEQIIALV